MRENKSKRETCKCAGSGWYGMGWIWGLELAMTNVEVSRKLHCNVCRRRIHGMPTAMITKLAGMRIDR